MQQKGLSSVKNSYSNQIDIDTSEQNANQHSFEDDGIDDSSTFSNTQSQEVNINVCI